MIAYHEGNGVLVDLTHAATSAAEVTFEDNIHIGADNVQTAVENLKTSLESDFSIGINTVYNAVVAKGQVPTTKSPQDIAYAISQITTEGPAVQPSGSLTIPQRSTSFDMGTNHWYRYANTWGVPNNNTETFTYSEEDEPVQDLGEQNIYRYVDATTIRNKGFDDGKKFVQDGITSEYDVLWGGGPYRQQKVIDVKSSGFFYVISARVLKGEQDAGSVGYRRVYLNGKVVFEKYGFVTAPIPVQRGDQIKMSLSMHPEEYIFLLVYLVQWPD